MLIDLQEIFVRRAKNTDDIEKVMDLRWKGYKKYFSSKTEIRDEKDFAANSILLLATDKNNNALGTIRILDRSCGRIELDDFLAVDTLLEKELFPCAEATRFSIPLHPNSRLIKFAFWKTFLMYCRHNCLNSMLIWVRSSAAKDYKYLNFINIGTQGVFSHSKLGDIEHHTYFLNLRTFEQLMRDTKHPLYNFLFTETHPQLSFD